MFMFACRMETTKPNELLFSVFFGLHDACFLEERCVAGGTVSLFCFVCTSPDDASLKGGCVMCEGKSVCVFSFGM